MLAKQLQIEPHELKENDDALQDFQFAFLTKNLKRIEALLAENGDFFGKHNRTEAKLRLYQLMHDPNDKEHCLTNVSSLGFSCDQQPGQPVIEFRYPNFTPENFGAYPNDDEVFGLPPINGYHERIVRIALNIKEGKITSLRIPKKVVRSLQRYIDEN